MSLNSLQTPAQVHLAVIFQLYSDPPLGVHRRLPLTNLVRTFNNVRYRQCNIRVVLAVSLLSLVSCWWCVRYGVTVTVRVSATSL